MYQASIEHQGESKVIATTRHGSFPMDTRGKASNPGDTFLAGLCGCVGHYVREFLDHQAIPAPRFAVFAEATATADQSRLAEITIRIDLGEVRLATAQERELVAFVERCKLHGTVRLACPISVVVKRQAAAVA